VSKPSANVAIGSEGNAWQASSRGIEAVTIRVNTASTVCLVVASTLAAPRVAIAQLAPSTSAQSASSAPAPDRTVAPAPAQPASPSATAAEAAPTATDLAPTAAPPAPQPASPAATAGSFAQYGYPGEVVAPPDRPTTAAVPESVEHPRRARTRFGEQGQFAILTGARLGISSASYTHSEASAFDVAFEPAIEYFVARNVSVGVELDVHHSHGRGYDAFGLIDVDDTLLGAGLHLGLNVPLSRNVSIYPLFAAGFHHEKQTWHTNPGAVGITSTAVAPALDAPASPVTVTRLGPWIQGTLPLLYHPVEHFFVGIGPSVYQDFSRAEGGAQDHKQRTYYGADFVLGGSFDFRSMRADEDDTPSPSDDPRPTERRPRKFGDAGTVLLTEESGFSWHAHDYSGSDRYTSVSVAGAFDWFFTKDQSLGLGAFYSGTSDLFTFYGGRQGTDAVGISGRYGFLVPFYSWFSIYLRMSLQYSLQGEEVGIATSHSNVLTASVFLPALAHLASHFFVGLGPSASEDLVHTEQRGPDVMRTAFGVTSVIGGWL
jgi:hypothetical protein